MFISRNEQQRYSVITLIRFQLTEIGVATWHLYNPNHWTRFVAGIPINQKQYRLLIPGAWTLTEQWLLTAWFAGKHTFISKVHGPWWIVTQLSDNQVRRHGDRNSLSRLWYQKLPWLHLNKKGVNKRVFKVQFPNGGWVVRVIHPIIFKLAKLLHY